MIENYNEKFTHIDNSITNEFDGGENQLLPDLHDAWNDEKSIKDWHTAKVLANHSEIPNSCRSR